MVLTTTRVSATAVDYFLATNRASPQPDDVL